MNMIIGIDFGTTQTKAAHGDISGSSTAIPNARGEDVTPTVLYVPTTGEPLIGTDAIEQGVVEPARMIRNFKLQLGSADNLLPDGGAMTPTDAVTRFVEVWKRAAESHLGFEICEAVVTCPADFRDNQKQALIDGFGEAGIKVLRLVPEPTAAGMAYAVDKGARNAHILVFDLGGGTFDVSVLRVQGAQITVLATEGIAKLGGNDFSAALKQHVLNELPNGDVLTDPLAQFDLDRRIEAAKISLGSQQMVPIVINQAIVKVTQEQFHTVIDPLVRQTLEAMDRAVAAAGLKFAQVDRLLMVGGTSRMPYIQQKVAEHTGLVPKTDIDPEKAIAYGAALEGLVQMTKQGRTATIRGQVIPAPDVFVRDVTAHDVGCAVAEKSGNQTRLVNAAIIPRNTPIPCQRVDRFYLEHEDQTAARIEVLQGETNADRDDCLLIGELTLDNLPKESKRTERIQVEYVIDPNGMVTATATDLVGGQRQTVSIEYRKGIKPHHGPAAA